DDTGSRDRSTRCFEPTGWPVATYSSTSFPRMSRWRGVSCICIAFAAILARFAARPLRRRPSLREQLGRHAAAEEPTSRRQRDTLTGVAAARPRREPELLKPADRREIDCALEPAERERLVEPQPEED